MKKILLFMVIFACVLFTSCDEIIQAFLDGYYGRDSSQTTNTQNSNNRQSLGNLRNTSWYFMYQGVTMGLPVNIGGGRWAPGPNVSVMEEELIEFGNGEYLRLRIYQGNISTSQETETGTYTVSGSTVIFKSSNGIERSGNIIGNTMTIDEKVFRRQ